MAARQEPKPAKIVPKAKATTVMTKKTKSLAKSGTVKTKPKKERFKFLKSLWLKEVVLGVVNLSLILVTVVFLGKLTERAREFKKARNVNISSSTKSEVEVVGLEVAASKEESDNLLSLFPDESGLIDFVREIDVLKGEGLVTTFAFASEKAVKDKTGHYGIPIVLEFEGSWNQIGQGLTKLNDVPFLLRAVSIEIERGGEGGNLIIFKYGGVLYVDESLAKNR